MKEEKCSSLHKYSLKIKGQRNRLNMSIKETWNKKSSMLICKDTKRDKEKAKSSFNVCDKKEKNNNCEEPCLETEVI